MMGSEVTKLCMNGARAAAVLLALPLACRCLLLRPPPLCHVIGLTLGQRLNAQAAVLLQLLDAISQISLRQNACTDRDVSRDTGLAQSVGDKQGRYLAPAGCVPPQSGSEQRDASTHGLHAQRACAASQWRLVV